MAKRLIICFLDSEIKRAVKLALQEKDSLVITLNGDVSELRKNNIRFKTLDDYSLSDALARLPKLVYEHYLEWGETTVGSQKLKDILNIRGFDFWANVQATFCDKLYAGYIPKGLKFVTIFMEIFSAEKPKEVFANLTLPAGLPAKVVADYFGIKFAPLSITLPSIPLRPLLARLLRWWTLVNTKKVNIPITTKSDKNKIMFVASLPSTIHMLLPIINATKEKHDVFCVSTELSNNEYLSELTEKARIPHISIYTYYSYGVKERVKNIVDEFDKCAKFKKCRFYFLGVDVTKFVQAVFGFYFFPRQHIKEVVLIDELFKEALLTERPDIIVTADESSDMSKPMLDYANNLGIKTLAVQHGPTGVGLYPAFNKTISPQWLAVWGESAAELYISHGFPADKVIIGGIPKLDNLIAQKFDVAQTAGKYGINLSRKRILVAEQIVPDMPVVLACLAEYAKQKDLQLIVKTHPRAGIAQSKSGSHKAAAGFFSTPEDLYQLMALSDVVVTVASVVCAEAAALGKPVILANFSGLPERLDYVREGIALGARSKQELNAALDLLLNSENTRKKLLAAKQIYFSKQLCADGKSVQRIIELIGHMSGKKS
ncbi:MAG: CDP-glycerol glycerophosphotransferase family protein [DPANN group archaeon]|nr:CDP-glycerol glycerophosphotransferase family protein [DPANN group archaeon]